ncbi:MAG: acyl-phosphate glycerol 3-phosphate acyltransferase [Candidatus Rokubacteria bacterium GWC2_70_16]|nr:MAG: acyl-phosphate glycerol 3-phosphate acyltransferase [Candidatus Rokubacteria bacterium GWC2_70_16]OGL16967.1 MAG: acyl-phosphate glycerol 3-phosphate acyltransferase [Candidatus Rokubacteria bacterium RIFCSPLOWO2_12_FULL_71_19]
MAVRGLGALLAYLIGAIPVGLLVARAAGGVDIRRQGSGNIGATNVLRTLGPAAGIVTLLGDVAKGYVAVAVAGWLGARPDWQGAGAVLAVAGNCWSPFLRFRGGKGVATGLGAFLALAPWAIVPSAAVWVALLASFRYVSLASMLACLGLPLGVALLGYPWQSASAAGAAAAIILVRHRENLRRLMQGTESRLGQQAPAD